MDTLAHKRASNIVIDTIFQETPESYDEAERYVFRKERDADAPNPDGDIGSSAADVVQTATGACSSNPCGDHECIPSFSGDGFHCACPPNLGDRVCGSKLGSCMMLDCEQTTNCYVAAIDGSLCICKMGVSEVFCGTDQAPPTEFDEVIMDVSPETREVIEKFTHTYLYVALAVFVMMFVCLGCHCTCVSKKRKEIKEEYRKMLKKGKVPSELPPDLLGISFIVLKGILCCKKKKKPEAKASRSKHRSRSRNLADREAAFDSLRSVRTGSKHRSSSNRNKHASGSIATDTDVNINYDDWVEYAMTDDVDVDPSVFHTYRENESNDLYAPYHENMPLLQQKSKSKHGIMKKRMRHDTKDEKDYTKYILFKERKNGDPSERALQSRKIAYGEEKPAKLSSYGKTNDAFDRDEDRFKDKFNGKHSQTKRHKHTHEHVTARHHKQSHVSLYDDMNDTISDQDRKLSFETFTKHTKHHNSLDPSVASVPVNSQYCHIKPPDSKRQKRQHITDKRENKGNTYHTTNDRHAELVNDKDNTKRREQFYETYEMLPLTPTENGEQSSNTVVMDTDETKDKPIYMAYSYSETPHVIQIEDSSTGQKHHNTSHHCSVNTDTDPPISRRSPGKYRQMMLSKAATSHNNNSNKIDMTKPRKQKLKLFIRKNRKQLLRPDISRSIKKHYHTSAFESVSPESVISMASLVPFQRTKLGPRCSKLNDLIYTQKKIRRDRNININASNANNEMYSLYSNNYKNPVSKHTESYHSRCGRSFQSHALNAQVDNQTECQAATRLSIGTELNGCIDDVNFTKDSLHSNILGSNLKTIGMLAGVKVDRLYAHEKYSLETIDGTYRTWIEEPKFIIGADLADEFPDTTQAEPRVVVYNDGSEQPWVEPRVSHTHTGSDLIWTDEDDDSTVVPTDVSTTDSSDVTITG